MAIIHKALHTTTHHTDQQVQPPVSIDISEHGAPIIALIPLESGLLGDVGKAPAPEVLVKSIAPVEAAKKNVRPAIVVEVPHGHAGAIVKHSVGCNGPLIEAIGKGDAGLFRREQSEPGFSSFGHLQLRPSAAISGSPLPFFGRTKPGRENHCHENAQHCKSHIHFPTSRRLEPRCSLRGEINPGTLSWSSIVAQSSVRSVGSC